MIRRGKKQALKELETKIQNRKMMEGGTKCLVEGQKNGRFQRTAAGKDFTQSGIQKAEEHAEGAIGIGDFVSY